MKKTYTEMDIQLTYWMATDIVTFSAGEFDDQQSNDLVGDDIFTD